MIPLSGDLPKSKGIKSENVESVNVTKGTSTLKRGFAHMLKNGVVMDVTTVEQARIAEEAGAVSVMVLDKLPSDVRKAGGVARTASLRVIQEIMDMLQFLSWQNVELAMSMKQKFWLKQMLTW